MNKLSPFHALTTPCPTIFLSNSSNTNKVSLVANLSKTPLAKGTARSNHVFLPTLLIILPNAIPYFCIIFSGRFKFV